MTERDGQSGDQGAPPETEGATSPADVGPLLPESTSDDTDAAWGEPRGGFDDEHYLRDVPPHHRA